MELVTTIDFIFPSVFKNLIDVNILNNASPSNNNKCGTCSKCLDICPTNAFLSPYKLDARKCISYLTIENNGHIPREFRKVIKNRIYGCDDCLAACPWNKFAQKTLTLSKNHVKHKEIFSGGFRPHRRAGPGPT